MDAFDGDSDAEDSQATQMLLDLMPERTSDALSPLSPARPMKKAPSPHPFSLDAAPESFSSRHSNSLPTYHYHGLAATQTQTQSNAEEEEPEEGSQKENIVTEARQTPLGSRAVVDGPSSSRASIVKPGNGGQTNHSLAHSKSRTPNSRPVAISSLNSPQMTDTARRDDRAPSRNTPRNPLARQTPRNIFHSGPSRGSPSARIPSEEPQMPRNTGKARLDGPSRLRSAANDAPSTSTSTYPSGHLHPSEHGNILVDATPSNSAGSQSHALDEATQPIDFHYGPPAVTGSNLAPSSSSPPKQPKREPSIHDGYDSSESIGRSCFVPTPEPTQVATQPATPPHELNSQEYLDLSTAAHTSAFGASRGAVANAPRSDPNSLINMGNPGTRYRYKQYQVDAQNPPNVPHHPTVDSIFQETQPATQPTDDTAQPGWVETQPTTEEDFRPKPRPNFAMPRMKRSEVPVPAPVAPAVQVADETMEIVPDSEPPAALSPLNYDNGEEEDPPAKEVVSQTPKRRGINTIQHEVEPDRHNAEPQASKSTAPTPVNAKVQEGEGVEEEEDLEEENEEEEYEDDEDDVPLASKASSKSRRGRGGARGTAKRTPASVKGKGRADAKKPARKAAPKSAKAKGKAADRSWEVGIPSSIPAEDAAEKRVPSPPPTTKSKQRANVPKSGAKAPVKRSTRLATKKADYKEDSDSDGEADHADDLPYEPSAKVAEEVDEDGYMDVDIQEQSGAATVSARKRKRAASSTPAVKQEKTGKRPPPKRARGNPAAEVVLQANATRVFAFWRTTGNFYPGTIHALEGNSQYIVDFDDGQRAAVELGDMRVLELRQGDTVVVTKDGSSRRVVEVRDGGVVVDKNGKTVSVDMKQICIPQRVVKDDWTDRTVARANIVPQVKAVTPSPSSCRGSRDFLTNTGIIVTLSNTSKNTTNEKDKLSKSIEDVGGTVVNDIPSLFGMDGKFDQGGSRWILHKSDVQWVGKGVNRLFLLADKPTQKPKYLYALAMGIPCIETTWLSESSEAGREVPWNRFLLGHCYSASLKMRISQQIDLDWGTDPAQLERLIDSPIPHKLYEGKYILCIGSGLLPQQPKRGQTPDMSESVNALARIILCMGAETVEAVRDLSLATSNVAEYDYVVVRDLQKIDGRLWDALPKEKLVDWEWVKACLLASRLEAMPYPSDGSQEA